MFSSDSYTSLGNYFPSCLACIAMLSRFCRDFSLQGGQGGGEPRDGLGCIAQSHKFCPLNKHTLVLQFAAKFKPHSSESQQMITLNS